MRLPSSPRLVLTLILAACTGPGTDPGTEPLLELVDETQRLEAASVNAHVYGSFVIPGSDGPTTILSGPANFPGNPPGGPGTCVDGLWYNSKGKPTAGTLIHPHPHCVTGRGAVTVVLEPISAQADHDPNVMVGPCRSGTLVCRYLTFGGYRDALRVEAGETGRPLSPYTFGSGTVYAYAIDAATLNGVNTRVGTIKFDLSQFSNPRMDLFATCEVPLGGLLFNCLNIVIFAGYEPLAVGGVGTAQTITGFLWWAGATLPYNYDR